MTESPIVVLATYLRDRLAEDDVLALKAAFGWGGDWRAVDRGDDWAEMEAQGSPRAAGSEDIDVLRHAARWDPARVLAEVEAKRALLDDLLAEPHDASAWCTGLPLCMCGRDDRVLRRLVLLCRPFMERPDFPTDALPEVAW